MSDNVTDKTGGFQSKHNKVRAASAFIDVARGACERIGVAS
jgi:hypothetical protein